jgi:hypothetical protein
MNANLRAMIMVVGCGLAACTTQEAPPTGNAGSGGSGTGVAGSGGSTGTGGGGGGSQGNPGVLCLPPDQLLTDFTYDADAGGTDQVRFGTFGTSLSGGQSAYTSLTGNVTGNDWHITGMITDYSGFNLYFDDVNGCNMVDASAYAGITFTIWGTLGGTGNMITMGMSTLKNAVKASWLLSVNDTMTTGTEPGLCMPASGNGRYYHPGCADASYTFSVTGTQAAPQTVSVMWNSFTGGMPEAGVTPSQILSVYWNVTWATGATPYPVDIHVDNLAFIPK